MKLAKSILAGTGALVMAGLILALLAPKAAHAIAATAVHVMNTSASPVPNQNVDEPGRHPFSLLANENCCSNAWTVPAGQRYVIEEYYARCVVNNTNTMTEVYVQAGTPALNNIQTASAPAHFDGAAGNTASYWNASGTTRLYAEPGQFIYVGASDGVFGSATQSCRFTASGYYLTLP
jgi:hypothetical protein